MSIRSRQRRSITE